MPNRDPYEILGVEPGASITTIKAAWRRLAREHHPDLTGGDGPAAREATRRMAAINAAYALLREGGRPLSPARTARDGTGPAASAARRQRSDRVFDDRSHTTGRAPAGAPHPQPGRPLTGRLDTTDTFRGRNRTTTPPGARPFRTGQRPGPVFSEQREPPRASDPTGPLRRSRVRSFRPPEPPSMAAAQSLVIAFGKFHGHTLGEIAAFEPSYIDWIASTVSRDAELVAAARVLRADLDRRGVSRTRRDTDRARQAAARASTEY